MQIPHLDLRTPEGAPAPWARLWQRKNLLLLVGHGDCDDCRRVLETWLPRLEEEEAAALAIQPAPPERPVEGVSYLVDEDGRLAEALDVSPGTVVAADRYFAVQARLPVHELGAEKAAREALDWIDLAERRCDECGVPTW